MTTATGVLLMRALDSYRSADSDDTYDETLRAVVKRAAAAQSLCKADIGSLVLWKRITASTPWAGALGVKPDSEVRRVTGAAWHLANDARLSTPEAGLAAFRELRKLPGLGGTGALASAVLVACAPDRMAVWDRRVSSALKAMGRRPKSSGFHGRYLEVLNRLIAENLDGGTQSPWTLRDMELALYVIGGNPALLAQAQQGP